MPELKELEAQFKTLLDRKVEIKIKGEKIHVPDGWAVEFAQTQIGFKANLMKIDIRELQLTAEKRVQHRFLFWNPEGVLVAEQLIDTGWEASGVIGTKMGSVLPSDYRVPEKRIREN